MATFELIFNGINESLVMYFFGSYWMLGIAYVIAFFMLFLMMDLGVRYSLAFSLPIFALFLASGWFTSDLSISIYNTALLALGFLLGLVLLKWIGDW